MMFLNILIILYFVRTIVRSRFLIPWKVLFWTAGLFGASLALIGDQIACTVLCCCSILIEFELPCHSKLMLDYKCLVWLIVIDSQMLDLCCLHFLWNCHDSRLTFVVCFLYEFTLSVSTFGSSVMISFVQGHK